MGYLKTDKEVTWMVFCMNLAAEKKEKMPPGPSIVLENKIRKKLAKSK
jgi:hypothetical protein